MSDNSHGARRMLVAVALVVLACCVLVLAGCTTPDENSLELTGSFLDNVAVLSVPAIPSVAVDYTIGAQPSTEGTQGIVASEGIATAIVPQSGTANPANAPKSNSGDTTRWHRVDVVEVEAGDPVVAGQTLAVLDTGPSQAALAASEADLTRAQADLGMLDQTSADIAQNRSDIASQTAELQRLLLDLQTQRADLQRQLDAARASIAPPSLPATATPPPTVVAQIKVLEAAIVRVDEAIEKAQQGIVDLTTAGSTLAEAETAVGSIKRVASAVIDGRQAVVNLMEAQLERATVTAPSDGVVVSAVNAGEVLAAGAPLVRIRTLERPLVSTYVDSDQARRVREGSSARVFLDSMPGVEYTGLVTSIGSNYVFVPTTFATRLIHMTRGFEVTIEVYGAPDLPPGTPADLVIQTD